MVKCDVLSATLSGLVACGAIKYIGCINFKPILSKNLYMILGICSDTANIVGHSKGMSIEALKLSYS